VKALPSLKTFEQARKEVGSYIHQKRAERERGRNPYHPRIYPCVIQLTHSSSVEGKWADVMPIRIIDAETQKEQANSDGWPLRLIPSGDTPYKYANPTRLAQNAYSGEIAIDCEAKRHAFRSKSAVREVGAKRRWEFVHSLRVV
jgi:hypothetical protein